MVRAVTPGKKGPPPQSRTGGPSDQTGAGSAGSADACSAGCMRRRWHAQGGPSGGSHAGPRAGARCAFSRAARSGRTIFGGHAYRGRVGWEGGPLASRGA